jgi:hypothetical protein
MKKYKLTKYVSTDPSRQQGSASEKRDMTQGCIWSLAAAFEANFFSVQKATLSQRSTWSILQEHWGKALRGKRFVTFTGTCTQEVRLRSAADAFQPCRLHLKLISSSFTNRR